MSLALPPIGLGCSPVRGEAVVDLGAALAAALSTGWRLFDTAEAYGTESLLGAALAAAPGGGEALVVGKLWQTNHRPEHVAAACEASLRRLRRASFDVYLIHSPEAWRHLGPLALEPLPASTAELVARAVPRGPDGEIERDDVTLEETWSALIELRRRGLVRHIGIANAGREELERLRRGGAPAEVVQVELHPLRPQAELRESCAAHGIVVMAHSPFGGGGLLADERLRALARAAGTSPAAMILLWHRALGVVPLPGAARSEHLRENLAAMDAADLGPETMRALAALGPRASAVEGA